MKNKIKIFVNFLLPLGAFYCLENFTHDITTMAPMPQFINYLIFLIAGIFLSALFGNTMIAGIILCFVTLGIGIANYFVLAFRGNPILPWDLKSINTALSVADNYNFTIDSRFVISTVGLLALAIISIVVRRKFPNLKKRLVITVICVFALLGARTALCTTAITDNLLTFTNLFTQWASYRDNGFVVSFLQNTQYITIKKPTGYDSEELESELQPYLEEQETTEKQPNIIVIMNESFSDLSVLHEFGTSEDYMPFIHSLQTSDEAITGNLYVSVCGGNTANTEFEFLTGDTMAFLPSGSVAYQQYISDNIPSWVTSLANQGYQTVAMHPYNASGWNRINVYPYLGFETSYFKDAFSNAKILRKYVSDESLYDKVIDVYNNKEKSSLFLFAVTMQNHGGYSQLYDNFPISVTLTDIENHPATENYLSLVKESDRAFEELVDYFRTVDEDTIIVMFGDHQPNDYVANCIARLTGTADDDKTLEEQQNRYLVPFVIWANYDIDSTHDITTSANYLNLLVSQTAKVELSDYQQYLLALQEEFPVITANLLVDQEGNYSSVSDLDSLQLYKKLQYMHLFDTKNRIDKIYEKK
jgi:phosphoglycerol transferase MdoB-like AlkP superfamily enzyme